MSVYKDKKRGTWIVPVYFRDYENAVHRKTERITYYYAHLFPGVQEEISERLDEERNLLMTN